MSERPYETVPAYIMASMVKSARETMRNARKLHPSWLTIALDTRSEIRAECEARHVSGSLTAEERALMLDAFDIKEASRG